MKKLEVDIKMAFLVFKKCKLSPKFCKKIFTFNFSEKIMKMLLTKRENALEKLKNFSFVTLLVIENVNFRVYIVKP